MAYDLRIRYVLPAAQGGNDANDGKTWDTAYATLQAAYDSIPTSSTARILLGPYSYDVGDGLRLDRRRPAIFESVMGRPAKTRSAASFLGTYIKSSTGSDSLISWPNPVGQYKNAYGFEFRGLNFAIDDTYGDGTVIFDSRNVNMCVVEDCAAFHPSGSVNLPEFKFIRAANDLGPSTPAADGDDSSWWRVHRNDIRGGMLVHAFGYALNRWTVTNNVSFADRAGTDPQLYAEFAHGWTIRDNNWEGAGSINPVGVHLKGSWGCLLSGNSGERCDPHLILEDSYSNVVMDLGQIYPHTLGVGDSTFVRLIGGSANNLIVSAAGTNKRENYQTADWIDDQSSGRNFVIAPSDVRGVHRMDIGPWLAPGGGRYDLERFGSPEW